MGHKTEARAGVPSCGFSRKGPVAEGTSLSTKVPAVNAPKVAPQVK